MIITQKKVFTNTKTDKTSENSENSKNGDKNENLGINFAWVPCI